MGLKIKFHFLVIFVYIITELQNALCMKNLDIESQKSKMVEISETKTPELAREIYNHHGVSDKDRLCRSIDNGKTSRIFGYGICKLGFQKLFSITYDFYESKIKCKYMDVDKSYKHGEVQKNFGKNYIARYRKHKMLYCGDFNGESIYMIYAKEDFYYVFKVKAKALLKTPTIRSCLKLNPMDPDDYPLAELQETKNRQVADIMFGLHGTGGFNSHEDKGHVCEKINKDTIQGRNICSQALHEYHFKPVPNKEPTCEKFELKRFIIDGCVDCPKKSDPIYMAKCWYQDGKTQKFMMVFNGPRRGLFFIARNIGKDLFITALHEFIPGMCISYMKKEKESSSNTQRQVQETNEDKGKGKVTNEEKGKGKAINEEKGKGKATYEEKGKGKETNEGRFMV